MQRDNNATPAPRDGAHMDESWTPGASEVRRIASAELFAGANEVIVEHQGSDYRLRCTSKGKLILTK